jgi:hypothetical protein
VSVYRREGIHFVFEVRLLLVVKVHAENLGAINLHALALVNNLRREDEVIEDSVMHSSEGTADRAHLGSTLSRALWLVENAAVGQENDVFAIELLLELTDKLGLDVLYVLEKRNRNKDDDGLLVTTYILFFSTSDVDLTELSLKLSVAELKIKERLGNRELKLVIFLAHRRILHKPKRSAKRGSQMRPVSRTLTAVHDAILDDLVFPTEIVDKRQRVKVDGTKVLRVYLDNKEKPNLEYKVDTFSSVYRHITGKDVVFEFATTE